MQKLIARLIDCGFSREEALAVFGKYRRQNRLDEFELYVEQAEQRTLEGDDELDLL